MSEQVPTRFVRTLLRMVHDKGYDFSVVLSEAGLDFDPLDETHPQYRSEVSALQYSRVYQSVLKRLQDETFGATSSQLAAPGAFRMMCYCVISCPTWDRLFSALPSFTAPSLTNAVSSTPIFPNRLLEWVIAPRNVLAKIVWPPAMPMGFPFGMCFLAGCAGVRLS